MAADRAGTPLYASWDSIQAAYRSIAERTAGLSETGLPILAPPSRFLDSMAGRAVAGASGSVPESAHHRNPTPCETHGSERGDGLGPEEVAMLPIRGVYEVAIRVRDLARAEPFYREVLGLEVGLRDATRNWL